MQEGILNDKGLKFRKIDQLEKSFEIKVPDEIEIDFPAGWDDVPRNYNI